MQDKKGPPADKFLVVNVASQEVKAWGEFSQSNEMHYSSSTVI